MRPMFRREEEGCRWEDARADVLRNRSSAEHCEKLPEHSTNYTRSSMSANTGLLIFWHKYKLMATSIASTNAVCCVQASSNGYSLR